MYPQLILVLFLVAQNCVSLPLKPTQIYNTCHYSGFVTNVEISGCEVTPCSLQRGTTVNIKINFHSNTPIKDLRMTISGVMRGIKIPFIRNKEICSNLNTLCPIEQTKPLEFSYSLQLPRLLPQLKLDVMLEIYDKEVSGDIVCIKIPVQIK